MDLSEALEESIERDERAMERLASAAELIASNLTLFVRLLNQWYERTYPVKGPVTDATITRIPTAEDKLRQEQGDTGEKTVEEWIGPRERVLAKSSK
jgi:hypothetical protein